VIADAFEVARAVAAELTRDGAGAVVLGGSVARGDAHRYSDIDLCALGEGPAYELRMVDGRLVSVSWRTPDGVRALLDSPPDAGGAVPAWRGAEVLVDDRGVAALLRDFAHEWRWARIDDACDAWLADEFPGYAEEVFRLAGMLDGGRLLPASAMRAVLALRLPHLVAVHRRLFYDSENDLWERVGAALGPAWLEASRRALGADPSSDPDGACRAALRLWVLAAGELAPLLGSAAGEVVAAAVQIAEEHA
jgi:hypothetical protein